MCLIIHRPSNVTIPQDWYSNAMIHNPDGWGIMASTGTRLQISRGMTQKGFSRAVKRYDDQEIFIHFRNATHGTVDIGNCHPFSIVNDQYAVMHNGVINLDTSSDDNRSDSWHYANRFLAPLLVQDSDVILAPHFPDVIGKHVGTGNKLVIMRADGSHAIVNRDQGTELHGCWLSNVYSISTPWDDRFTFSCSELGKLDRDELILLCQEDPEGIADAILDEFKPFPSLHSRDWDYR